MTEYGLFDKSELRIEGIRLVDANLTEIAEKVADAIAIDRKDVLVIDVRDEAVCLDVLRSHIDPNSLVNKQTDILDRLSAVPGVTLDEKAAITSKGMLGWIAMDEASAGENIQELMNRAERMAEETAERLKKTAIVFSSGIEVETGQIEDTNTPMIANRLKSEGYYVKKGPTLKDDEVLFAGVLRSAVYDGYAVIITTGGVGAEDKDHSVEAILRLDPDAETPYLAKYEVGTGRHHKDGVRIGVGEVGGSLLVALPGPNDEVKLALDALVDGLKSDADKNMLAMEIARVLRQRLLEKMAHRPSEDCGFLYHKAGH